MTKIYIVTDRIWGFGLADEEHVVDRRLEWKALVFDPVHLQLILTGELNPIWIAHALDLGLALRTLDAIEIVVSKSVISLTAVTFIWVCSDLSDGGQNRAPS